jgi:hypothetical protein
LGHCPECEVITYNGKLCRYHEGMRVLNELEAALATVTCERDDLLYTLNKERWEANDAARVAGTEWHKALDRCRELDGALAEVTRERDEARDLARFFWLTPGNRLQAQPRYENHQELFQKHTWLTVDGKVTRNDDRL